MTQLLKTTPFDLEAFKKGDKALTADGKIAEFVAHVPSAMPTHRLLVKVGALVRHYKEDGTRSDPNMVLRMAAKTVTREVWVQVVRTKLPGFGTYTVEVRCNVVEAGQKPVFGITARDSEVGTPVLVDTFEDAVVNGPLLTAGPPRSPLFNRF